MVDPTDLPPSRFTIENRTSEAARLTYLDRTTGDVRDLTIPSEKAGVLDGDPAELRWLNVPPAPSPFLSVAEVDALDAAREPGTPPWAGLAHRMEPAPLAEVGGL